jgi:hypothetical protein
MFDVLQPSVALIATFYPPRGIALPFPKWVKNGPDRTETSLPIHTDQRTSSDRSGWSVSCQHQTSDMRINAGAAGCLRAFHFRHRGASVSSLRRLRGHGISSGSGMQRPKQLRGLPDVGSFESFSKRRAQRAEQFATLPAPTLVSPKPRQADRRAQLKRFGGLASGRR